VKGDLEQMKEEIKAEDIRKFKRDSWVYAVMLIGMIVLPMPLLYYLKVWGIVIWLLWTSGSLWWGWRIEKYKKAHDIHTYKEIVAFMDGKRLDELEKNQEIGKRPYQIVMLVLLTAIIGLIVVIALRKLFFNF